LISSDSHEKHFFFCNSQIDHSYTAGVDFSPDRKAMYVSFWGEATWQFWRDDGLAFDEPTAGIVYGVMGGLDE
jgi:hypothetical protein